MATSAAAVLDRVRDLCKASGLTEAVGAADFEKTPQQAVDGAYVVTYTGGQPIGGTNFSEEARGTLAVAIARTTKRDFEDTRRDLFNELEALLSDIVRDGAADGEFAIDDVGRALTVDGNKGASTVIGRLACGVNFEVQL